MTQAVALATLAAASPFNTTHLLNFITQEEVAREIGDLLDVRVVNRIVCWQAAVEAHALLAKVIVLNAGNSTNNISEEVCILELSVGR